MTKQEASAAQYRIWVKHGEVIKVGGFRLRPDRPHIVSKAVLDANKAKVDRHEAV